MPPQATRLKEETNTDQRPAFDVRITRLSEVLALVEVQGEIDIYTAPQLDNTLVDCVRDGVVHIVVDLVDVSFVDSTALGVLVTAAGRVLPRDGWLRLVCHAGHVRHTFELTGLHRFLRIYPSREAALAVAPS